ncbi:MAG: hypothetical protein O3C21_19475, partial [Verrucomicrobia bacterium]|nr:hypothetical protein [Verrucomicrobiota bacterium]
FKCCQRKKLLAEGLTEAERVPKRKVPSKPVEIFTAEQMQKLLVGIEPEMVPYAVLGAFVGLRPSEAAATTWDRINLDEGFVEVVSEHKTGCRFVPLHPVAKAWLEPFRGARLKHMEDGQLCYSAVVASRKLSLAARELGIVEEWPEDVLRHSYGSYRLSVIANKARLAEEMGNSTAVIDKHYRRPIPPARGIEWFEIFPEFVTHPSHAPNQGTLTKPLLKVVSG